MVASAPSKPPSSLLDQSRSRAYGSAWTSGAPSKYSNASLASQPPQLRLKPAPRRRTVLMLRVQQRVKLAGCRPLDPNIQSVRPNLRLPCLVGELEEVGQ